VGCSYNACDDGGGGGDLSMPRDLPLKIRCPFALSLTSLDLQLQKARSAAASDSSFITSSLV